MVIAALKPLLKLLGEDKVSDLWKLVTDGQDTDITEEDIAGWSAFLTDFAERENSLFHCSRFRRRRIRGFRRKSFDRSDRV